MYHVSLKYADHIWNLSKKRKKEKILYFIHVKFCKHDPYWPEQDPLTNIRYVSMLSNCHILILNRWKAVHLPPCNGNKILTLPRQYSFRHLVACVTKSALYASHSCAFQHLPHHTPVTRAWSTSRAGSSHTKPQCCKIHCVDYTRDGDRGVNNRTRGVILQRYGNTTIRILINDLYND